MRSELVLHVTGEHDAEESALLWPRDLLDVPSLLEGGWRPRPFEEFIVKVNSRCNLACTYCYVYESVDQSWRDQPVRMREDTVRATARRIGEHTRAHGLGRVRVVLHGGEPLLAGAAFIAFFCETVRAEIPAATKLDLYLQTNGTLLTDELLTVLGAHHVRIGVSIDGDAVAHDARRINAAARGSHADVLAGLERLRSATHRASFAGLLCVVDPSSDPIATYEGLLVHEPPAIDLLLPHANWSAAPVRPAGDSPRAYGDWLIAIFDHWYGAPERETSIRLFDEIMRGLLGLPSRVESIGVSQVCMAVVETDGSIEQSDALKTTYPGAASTGLDVHRDAFDAALLHPGIAARQIGVAALADMCSRCELAQVCGGGSYPHRYLAGSGFRNPSVYCADLMALIRHIRARMKVDLGVAAGSRP